MPKAKKSRNGTWTIVAQFAGKRRTITLGKLPKSHADAFAANLNLLIEHNRYGGNSLPPKLQAWINEELCERHKTQLSEIGLFEYRTCKTVGDLIDAYLLDYLQRADIEPSTKTKVKSTIENRFQPARRYLLDVVEPAQRSPNPGAEPIWSSEAKRLFTTFNSWQRNHFSPATWTRDNKLLSSIGIWAVKCGYCTHNPFVILPCSSMVNDERNAYVESQWVADAMEACLSPDTRLTFALGRYAGLRTCSEVRTMKWSHVDTKANTLTVIDSKKKKPRVMPLFEHVLAELERQRKITGHTKFVASAELRSTSSSANFGKMKDAVSRSGQESWDRLRQNLRTSCENDLLALFDERLVTQWLGHTVTVSRKHYQKLRPRDYLKAIQTAASHLDIN